MTPQALVAIALIVVLTWIHVRGVGPGRVVQNCWPRPRSPVSSCSIAPRAFGLVTDRGRHIEPTQRPLAAGSWLLALVPVMFSYSGWNAASYVAEEIRNPERFVPRALALGTGAVVLLYVAAEPALRLFDAGDASWPRCKGSVMDVIAERLFGPVAGDVLARADGREHRGERQRDDRSQARASISPWRATACSSARPSRSIRVYGTPATAILAQSLWSVAARADRAASTAHHLHGFSVVLFSGIAGVRCSCCAGGIPTSRGPSARGAIR